MKKIESTSNDIALSKLLSWVLRHGADQLNLPIESNGFVDIETLLKLQQFSAKHYKLSDIQVVVANDKKGRFSITTNSNGHLQIKANQGHSLHTIKDLNLRQINSATKYPIVVHGTYRRHWPNILATGLNRMNRVHIHFAINDFLTSTNIDTTSTSPISGIRQNCEILIYCNLQLTLNHNIQFFLSDNNVVLTSGIDGILPVKYFSKVVDRKTGELLKY